MENKELELEKIGIVLLATISLVIVLFLSSIRKSTCTVTYTVEIGALSSLADFVLMVSFLTLLLSLGALIGMKITERRLL